VEGVGAAYHVYARVTRKLPRNRQGGTNGTFDLGFAAQGDPVLNAGRGPHGTFCYQQIFSTAYTAQPRAGERIHLTLRVYDHQHRRGTLSADVKLIVTRRQLPSANDYNYRDPFAKRLGCPLQRG
jgi:hypothetical protein